MSKLFGRRSSAMRRIAISIVFLSLLLFLRSSVQACECGVNTTTERVKAAKFVFSGEVIQTRESKVGPGIGMGWQKVTFAVRDVWKGSPGKHISTESYFGGLCLLDKFKVGETYIVFVSAKRRLSFCSGTRRLTDLEKDLRDLGNPKITIKR